jgi:hypothetical protein
MQRVAMTKYYLIYDEDSDQILTDSEKLLWDLTSCDLDNTAPFSKVNSALFWDKEMAQRVRDVVYNRIIASGEPEEDWQNLYVIKVQPTRVTTVENEWEPA